MIRRYRKKPVVVEALRWMGQPIEEVKAFCPPITERTVRVVLSGRNETTTTGSLLIPTIEGLMTAQMGDWIIKGVAGEFYPCRDDIFQQTYEAVN